MKKAIKMIVAVSFLVIICLFFCSVKFKTLSYYGNSSLISQISCTDEASNQNLEDVELM